MQVLLEIKGIKAGRYHAGMTDEERNQMQEDFLYDNLSVMVATNAFGMGIDKPNVRYVIHYNMPKIWKRIIKKRVEQVATDFQVIVFTV